LNGMVHGADYPCHRRGQKRQKQFAEQLIAGIGGDIAYIATAKALDGEMEDRIAKHRLQRPSSWQTFENPTQPSAVIAAEGQRRTALLLDCLTVMITNRMLAQAIDWDQPTRLPG
jgi:adenosylcobinamide kinase / adenosylcobinamide-phosphate guanylyltransferase